MLNLRLSLISALIGGLAASLCPSASAIIVENMAGTTAAPVGVGNDPGWNNVTVGGLNDQNFIYLGDGWALSAAHVGPLSIMDPDQRLHFASGPIDVIPGAANNYVIPNPGGVPNPGPNQLALESDLRLVRLKEEPAGAFSIFDASPRFILPTQSILNTTPENEREVTFIGHGRTRQANPSYWNSSWEPASEPGMYSGYVANDPNDDTKRWGKNRIADVDALLNLNDGDPNDLRVTFRSSGGVTRDTISMVTQFNSVGQGPGQGGLTHEAQAVDKDSGTAVFHKRNDQWELTGIVTNIYTLLPDTNPALPNQPPFSAVYGNLTAFADLSFYHNAIMSYIQANPNYSIVGDIDLDGEFLNDLTDDMAAFVAGWGNDEGEANLASWTQGDISGPLGLRDGITDVYDFIAFRDEMNNPAASAAMANLLGLGGTVVPEPTAAGLALVAAAFLAAFGRGRRRHAR